MAKHRPLFPEESLRTRQYRKIIVRKTLQIARENPGWTDEEIAALAEKEVAPLCDLCVESSFERDQASLVGKYFLGDCRDERQDHVGRFFLHRLVEPLRANHLTNCLIPVFAQSVASLLGQDAYENYSKRLGKLIARAMENGTTYNEAIESESAQILLQDIIDVYKHEMSKTASFEDLLKNKLDAELVKYLFERHIENVNIEEAINQIYDEFIRLMNSSSPQKSLDRI